MQAMVKMTLLQILIDGIFVYKNFTYKKTSGQAVDAPVKKCVLTKQKGERL